MFSCDKEEITQTSNQPGSNHSFLRIQSGDDLQSLLEKVGDYETYDEFLAQNPSFESYHNLHEAEMSALAEAVDSSGFEISSASLDRYYKTLVLESDENEMEVSPTIKILSLRRILNEDGVVQIEDKLYQYTPDEMLSVLATDVLDVTDLSSSPGVVREPYLLSNDGIKASVLEGICTHNYFWSGSEHRLKPRWYSEKFKVGKVDFRDVWIEIKHQKRGLFNAWYANSEDRIWSSGFMTVTQPPGSTFPTEWRGASASRNNASQLEKTIDTDPMAYPLSSNPSTWVVSTSNVDHRSQDGGASAACRIIK